MTDAMLRAVADRQAITDQIYRYCRSMDRMDHRLGYSIWHEDGTADYGSDVYQGTGRGFIDFVCKQHESALTHSHQVTNIVIELDGDTATSESYVTMNMQIEREGKRHHMLVLSRYLDRWSRRDGRWAIDHRITVQDMDDIREAQPLGKQERSRRDRSDPSYELLTQ